MPLPSSPGNNAVSRPILEDRFVIPLPRPQAWELIGPVVLNCLPFEQIRITDEKHFVATLKVPLAWFHLSLDVRGSLELDPPKALVCSLQGESRWRLLRPRLKVGFILEADQPDRTSITAFAARDGTGRRGVVEWLLSAKELDFTRNGLGAVRKSLEQLAGTGNS